MGMFDYVRCKYSLPNPAAQDLDYQTKSTPCPYLERWEIREDGTIWHEVVDYRGEDDDESPVGVTIHCDNPRWVQQPFNGEFEIHTADEDGTWYSFSFWFRDGVAKDLMDNTATAEAAKCPTTTKP